MKKLILLLAISVSAFAASAQNTAKVSSSSLKESKTSGVYTFTLSDNITQENVDAVSHYYTQYFSTSFDPAKHEVKVTLTENADINKRVIQRMFVGMDIRDVVVDNNPGKTYEEVYETYMK